MGNGDGIVLNIGGQRRKPVEPDAMDRLVADAQEHALEKGLDRLGPGELQMVLHAWSAKRIIDGLDEKARQRQAHVLIRLSPWGVLTAMIWLASLMN